MAARTIAPKFEPLILKAHMDGMSEAEITAMLERDHDLRVSPASVHRVLARTKTARKELAKQVYAEAVAKTAGSDVDILNDTIEQINIMKNEAYQDRKTKGKVAEFKSMATAMKDFLAMRMGLSGVDRDDLPEDENNTSELLSRIRALKGTVDKSN